MNEPVIIDKIFQVVEQMPQYRGGEDAMTNFIQDNIVYPDSALKYGIQGRVVIGFVVNEDGSLTDINIKKRVWPDIDAEALRVVRLMPKFQPGKQQGKTVKVAYIVPIMFRLPGSAPDPVVQPYDPRKRRN